MERAGRILNTNIAPALAGAAALVAIAWSAHLFFQKTEQLAQAVANVAVVELRIDGVYTQALEAESSQRGFLVTGDRAYLDPFHDARDRAEQNFAAAERHLQKLDLDEGAARLGDLRGDIKQKFDELDQTVALAESGRRDEALAIVTSNKGRALMARIRERVAAEHASLASLRKSWVAQLQDSASKLTLLTFLGVIVVVLVSALAVTQLVSHSRELSLAQHKLASVNDVLETRVSERTRDLKRANEEVQRYAYIISHDLRAPLVNIIGFARELENAVAVVGPAFAANDPGDPGHAKADAALREDIPEALKFIRMSTTRMEGLIAGILKLSRLGGLVLQPQILDLDLLTRECMATVQHRLNDAGAGVEIEGRLPSLVGDRAAISQILGNLLDNAAKYLSDERPGRIVVRAHRFAFRTLIEIEDNGRGIAPKDQDRIFELFRRAGAQNRPGDGIGLPHVRAMARRMGGDIAVRSDGASGSTFIVTLPNDLRTIIAEEQKNA